jgi:hypothetical protein
VAGFGTAATLTLVGVMALESTEDPQATTQEATPNVVVMPSQAAVGAEGVTAPPVQLDAQPSTRVQIGNSPTPLRVAPDASTSGSR